MDEAVIILFFGALLLGILFGPWLLLWRSSLRRNRERAEDQARWSDLTNRMYAVERLVEKLGGSGTVTTETTAETKSAAEVRASASSPAVAPPEINPPAPKRVPPPIPPPTPSAEPPRRETVWASEVAPPLVQPEPPMFASLHQPSSSSERRISALNLEETLGTNWLNKVGIAFVVLGIASFLAYQLRTMGPAGKVVVGIASGVVLLGAGIWFERHDRYRILARAGIGGGWALVFFTSYAMYFVPATHVLSSQAADLVLMLAVAAAMVWHTLRYRSQVVTGLALLLAFLTVTISHDTVYSLSAGAVLAAALVVIVGRMRWFELEIFGILASYLNHYLWLRPIIEPMQGHHHPFPQFAASAGILSVYWLIFRLSYVFRRPQEDRQERISTAAALLNTSLLLALFKYQSTHPEWAFWALLAIGGIETLLGQLPVTRRRRTATIVLSTLGVALLIAAFPFRYSGTRLAVLWLLEAEALLLIGVWTREVIFRRLGMAATVLVAGQMLSFDAARVAGMRMDGADVRPNFTISILFAVAAAVFYADSLWVLRRWRDLFATEYDRHIMQRLSYVGALMLFIGAWIAFPQNWTAVSWAVLGLALAWLGQSLGLNDLVYQAYFATEIALLRVAIINFADTTPLHGISLRLITVLAVAALFYTTARWSATQESKQKTVSFARNTFAIGNVVAGTYTWAASLLLSLLAWYELRAVSVAVAWVIGGLILFELGLSKKSPSLRLQAYVLFVAGFTRIFFVNLNAAGAPGEPSPRFYSVIPITLAFFYAQWRLHHSQEILLGFERKLKFEDVFSYYGTISVGALMRFELPPDWVATAWAALAFTLILLAWRSKLPVFLHQSLLMAFGVLFRGVLHNLYERSYFPAPFWQSRWICAGSAIGLLFACLPLAFRLRKKEEASSENIFLRFFQAVGRHPEQFFFFCAVGLLTALLALEMRHGMVTVSWGFEGVAIFLLALRVGERSFRLSGLGLLLLCVGKILAVDVWRLSPPDRYLTLIVLGSALLLVSFLYTRNRDALRQYL